MNPQIGERESSNLRLANPGHPARKLLDEIAAILNEYVEVSVYSELSPTRSILSLKHGIDDQGKPFVGEANVKLEQAIALCPADADLLVAKASLLHSCGWFKSAEEVLDSSLMINPTHFEASTWKNHWESWSDVLKFPEWNERQTILHPVMAMRRRSGDKIQVVRDGLQKTIAIVLELDGRPFETGTEVKTQWILSKTPYGPIIAHYLVFIEPSAGPWWAENFLNASFPVEYSPRKGFLLFQQLAFTPYCFVVAISGGVMLNRKVVFGEKLAKNIREIAAELWATRPLLSEDQFDRAGRWHMDNFDMDQLTLD